MKNTNRVIQVWWSDNDNEYVAIYIDNPLISGFGDTMFEAINELIEIQGLLQDELGKILYSIMGREKKDDEDVDEVR